MLTTIAVLGIANQVGAPLWVSVLCWITLVVQLINFGKKLSDGDYK